MVHACGCCCCCCATSQLASKPGALSDLSTFYVIRCSLAKTGRPAGGRRWVKEHASIKPHHVRTITTTTRTTHCTCLSFIHCRHYSRYCLAAYTMLGGAGQLRNDEAVEFGRIAAAMSSYQSKQVCRLPQSMLIEFKRSFQTLFATMASPFFILSWFSYDGPTQSTAMTYVIGWSAICSFN